jgi:hypothetical protein
MKYAADIHQLIAQDTIGQDGQRDEDEIPGRIEINAVDGRHVQRRQQAGETERRTACSGIFLLERNIDSTRIRR